MANGRQESVGSLLRRLGTPPADLAKHLAVRFRVACVGQLAKGVAIDEIRLDDWFVNAKGEIVFDPKVRECQQPGLDADTLTKSFESLLAVPRPGNRLGRIGDRDQPCEIGSADRFGQHPVDETETSQLSDVEQLERDVLIKRFTQSLVDRFGEEVIAEPAPAASKTREVKPQLLQRDRRFNWNLVLGVGTAVAILAMGWTGYQVTKIRHNRLIENPSSKNVRSVPTERVSNAIEKQPTRAPVTPKNLERPDIDPNDIKPLPSSPGSAFSSKQESEESFDVMDEFGDLELLIGGENYAKADVNIDVPTQSPVEASDLIAMRLPRHVSLDINQPSDLSVDSPDENAMTEAGDSPSLNDVLGEDAGEEIPELPQRIRRGPDRFVELVPADRSDGRVVIDRSGIEIKAVNFPVEYPISIVAGPDTKASEIVNQKSGTTLAQISIKDGKTLFSWASQGSRDSLANQLVHGRLVDASDGLIYLRPSIETDPYSLTMDASQARASWKLGAPILPQESRLQLSLTASDQIEWGWDTPFNSTRPKRGTAVAILTPPGGETVAIAVRLIVQCTRKLDVRVQYAARLDRTLPWQAFSTEGFNMAIAQVRQQLHELRIMQDAYERSYSAADLTTRKTMRRRRDEIESTGEILHATEERLKMLFLLAKEMESSVKLGIHLYVQWPDSQQTILRTASVTAENPQN